MQTQGGFPRYVFSGRTPIVGLIFGAMAGTVAALVLSIIYVLGTIFIPIVQIEFMLTLAFGAAIGAATGFVMHLFKVRSTLVVAGMSFCLGVFGWVVSWPPWIYSVFQQAGIDISPLDVLNPLFLMDALPEIYRVGTWSIGRSATEAVSGLPLLAVWVCEAVMIIGTSTFVGAAMGGDRVFCEPCETWCTMLPRQADYDVDAIDQLAAALTEKGDLAPFLSTPPPADPARWASVKLGFCPQCGVTNVIGLDLMFVTVTNKGQRTVESKLYTPYVCIGREQMTWLRDGLAKQASGQPFAIANPQHHDPSAR